MTEQEQPELTQSNDGTWYVTIEGVRFYAAEKKTLLHGLRKHFKGNISVTERVEIGGVSD